MYEGSDGLRPPRAGEGEPTRARWRLLVVMLVVVILTITLSTYILQVRPMTWGDEGELALTITLGAREMPLNGSIPCVLALTNVGDTDLRVLAPWSIWLVIRGPDGQAVQYKGPAVDRGPYMDKDLVTLRAGKTLREEQTISMDSWSLEAGLNYTVHARYHAGPESEVRLPYWQGEVLSVTEKFSVH